MQTPRLLAHVSDLHLGKDPSTYGAVARVRDALLDADVDDVLVTGDVTHRGRASELATFERLFAPLGGRALVVPGNHDRLGDGVAAALMPEGRVAVCRRPGLFAVRFDSTGPHNRALLSSHGAMTGADADAIVAAVRAAPPGALVALALHHHLLPLPADGVGERLSGLLGLPNAAELRRGRELLARIQGTCDLVAHGHRHAASEVTLAAPGVRKLRVMNAGATPALQRVRILVHAGGRIVGEGWLDARKPARARAAAVDRVRVLAAA